MLCCLPSLLGWGLVTIIAQLRGGADAFDLAFIAAGWWGLFALFWLLVVLDRTTISVPWHVATGLLSGCAVLAGIQFQGVPLSVVWFLFTGMPLVVAACCVLLIAINRRSTRPTDGRGT